MGTYGIDDINKLNVPADVKEKCREILWYKGSEALRKYLLECNLIKIPFDTAMENLEAFYPDASEHELHEKISALIKLGKVEEEF